MSTKVGRLRVTRTIVVEGDADWVRETLKKSWLQPGSAVIFSLEPDAKTLRETSRVWEEVDEKKPKTFINLQDIPVVPL